jgi:hypothetical protein
MTTSGGEIFGAACAVESALSSGSPNSSLKRADSSFFGFFFWGPEPFVPLVLFCLPGKVKKKMIREHYSSGKYFKKSKHYF